MKLGVKKLHDNAKLPEYHSDGASGFDIAILYRVEIPPDCWEVVPTGLAFDIPDGY